MQQKELSTFLNQVAFKSNDLATKLEYTQNMNVLPHQLKAAAAAAYTVPLHNNSNVFNVVNMNSEHKMTSFTAIEKSILAVDNAKLNKNLIKASHIKSTDW